MREASSNESISADSGSKADLAARSELQRLVGSLPVSRVRHFKNRREQLKTLKDAVSRGPSLTQVCGRGGAGKTALVTKLLLELRGEDADHAAVDAIVYASLHEARARSVDSIVGLIHPALDPNRSEALRARWTESIPLQDKLEFLFQFAFRDDRLLIVLDNLEDVLDETNQIRSEYADLQAFIEICLDYETSARLLVASRRPLSLPYELVGRLADRYIEVSLDEGLPERDAVALLRELDGDGRLGFQRAEEETLREVVGRCHGMPRLLESLVGTLRQKRTWDITKLLTDRAALESIVEFPARELYHSLSDEERAVMQALAVYEIPIPAAAVKHLLPALEIDDLLENLARNYAVYYDAGKFSLHPLDQAFAYAQIPEKGTEHSRKQLHLKAAVFYSITGNPKVKPKTLEDVQPQLREFFHLVRAGWHETACKVLNEIDHRYLLMWGHAALAVNLRKSLQDWLDDRELEARNLEGLGDAYCDLGQLFKSVKYLQQAHYIYREIGNRKGEARVLNHLGISYHQLGDYRKAIELLEQAREIAHELDAHRLEARAFLNLGNAHLFLDNLREAAGFYERGQAISHDIGDNWLEGRSLLNLGMAYTELDVPGMAIAHYQRAIEVFRDTGDRLAESAALINISHTLLKQGKPQEAIVYLEQALANSREVGDRLGEGSALENLGTACLDLGETQAAIDHFQRAFELARETGARKLFAEVLDGLGRVYNGLGQTSKTLALWVAAYLAYVEIQSPEQKVILKQLSDLRTRHPFFEVKLEELSRSGDSLVAEVTGQAFTFYQDAPPNFAEQLLAALDNG